MDTESIRQSFRPSQIRLLLVGESPPASGRFFYVKSAMTTYTARAFEKAHGTPFSGEKDFLQYFKACGCYLNDLSHAPVDNLAKGQRDRHLKASIDALAQRIPVMNPDILVIALKRIEPYVREAVHRSGRQLKVFILPFAGNGHQTKYVDQLSEILRTYLPTKR
jgi:hypothetical protein